MHRHENEEEGFYIVDGQVTIFADSAENQLGPGGFAFVPRGTTHAFRLDSTQATLLLLISPGNAGHESMFREMGEPAAQPELPAPPRRSIRGPWPRSPSDTGRSSSGRRLCPDLAPSRVRRDSPGFWSTIRTTVIWGGPDYAGSVERINGDVARRVRSQHLNHDDGLITMGSRNARHELLQGRRRPLRMGAAQGTRHQHHGPRRDGPLRVHQDAAAQAEGDGPPLPEHDLHPLIAPSRR
ncbi:MAG: hypothetical protein DLM71_09165 [Chloroflexi bacterium]|nr:MAG: hypothetical protein DLM71_09165 [Chloroflexota bacterium]